MNASYERIAWSLERLSEVHGDPAAAVYARLFAQHPNLEALFVLDRQSAVRGNMLANVFEALLDMAGPHRYGLNAVLAERVNHEGMGVTPDVFPIFFETVHATVRDLLGAEWAPEIESAWRSVLDEINAAMIAAS
jgi:hemoglobin-like flavoprotein